MKTGAEVRKVLKDIEDPLGRLKRSVVYKHLPDILAKAEQLSSKRGISWQQVLYDYAYKPTTICPVCNSKDRTFLSLTKGYAQTCSKACGLRIPTRIEKRRATTLQRYGVLHTSQLDSTKEKLKATFKDRYGVTHQMDIPSVANRVATKLRGGASTFYTEDFKEKRKATLLRKYGVDTPCANSEIAEARRQTNLNRYGTTGSFTTESLRLRDKTRKQTCQTKYGQDHWMQVREIADKSAKGSYSIKRVTIGGKLFKVRGYEPQAIEYLHSIGVPVSDIRYSAKGGVPNIRYQHKGRRVYHPDLYVKRKGVWWVVEVKSTYTCGLFSSTTEMYGIMQKKFKATSLEGFNMLLIVVGDDSSNVLIKNPQNYSKSQLKSLVTKGLNHGSSN